MGSVNRVLFVIVLLLGGVLLLLEKPWAVDRYAESAARRGTPLFSEFDPTKASRIELSQGADRLVLERTAAGWTIPSLSNFRANEDAVARLLERVRAMTKADLVTEDPANFVKYRVGDAEAPRVLVQDGAGRTLADFRQGRPYFDPEEAQSAGGRLSSLDAFVRPSGSKEVYRVGDFHPIEPIRASDWIPRSLYRFEIPAIQTLTIGGSDVGEELALNHLPGGDWQLVTPAGPVPANRDACDALARSFASIYLEDVVGVLDAAANATYGFDAPRLRIFASLAGGNTEELLVGRAVDQEGDQGAKVFVTGGLARSHVARVYQSSIEALKVSRAQLLEPHPPGNAGSESAPASQPSEHK